MIKIIKLNGALLIALLLLSTGLYAQTGINTKNPDQNSALHVESNTKGVLIPRLTNGEVNTLAGKPPAEGMLVYNSTEGCIQIFVGGSFQCLTTKPQADLTKDAWVDDPSNTMVKVGSTSTGGARPASSEVIIKDTGNVGVGTTTPQNKLHVVGGTQLTGELNVGGNASTSGSAGTTGQVLTSHGAGNAPSWEPLSRISGTIAAAVYKQGTSAETIPQGSTKDVPGLSYTHTVPEGITQTLLFNVVGYTVRPSITGDQAGQGTFTLMQTTGGTTTKISSAYASVGDIGDLANVPIPATLLKSITLNPGTYTFKVQYKSWSDDQIVNYVPSAYLGYSGDNEAMLTKMQILVYNN